MICLSAAGKEEQTNVSGALSLNDIFQHLNRGKLSHIYIATDNFHGTCQRVDPSQVNLAMQLS